MSGQLTCCSFKNICHTTNLLLDIMTHIHFEYRNVKTNVYKFNQYKIQCWRSIVVIWRMNSGVTQSQQISCFVVLGYNSGYFCIVLQSAAG